MTDTVLDKYEAWLNGGDTYQTVFDAFKAGRESMREEAMQACDGEHLQEPTDSPDDIAYDNAVRDCKSAIKSLP